MPVCRRIRDCRGIRVVVACVAVAASVALAAAFIGARGGRRDDERGAPFGTPLSVKR